MIRKLGFYAVGIPERNRFTPLREIKKPEMWQSALHSHDAQIAGHHFDLRLLDPKTRVVYSFVVQRMPNPGEKVLAIRQQDHSPEAMGAIGEIKKGYGKGVISQVFKEPIEVTKSEPGKFSFVIPKAGTPERFTLLKVFEGKNWLLINHTPVQTSRQLPLDKPKYPQVDTNSLNSQNENEIWSPKLDGSHNLFVLRAGKPIETFSYRKSRRGDRLIDHSYKTDLYKTKTSPHMKGETIVRGELVGLRKDQSGPLTNTEIAGMLNAATLKSREMQREKGKLEPYIFDIAKLENKDVSNAPYDFKLELLERIKRLHPQLKIPPMARNFTDKQIMLSDIKAGVHPLTREGVVIYNKNQPVPTKAPFVKSTELRILGFYPAAKGSKYEGRAVGGYIAEEGDQKPKIRVGSGLNDVMREDMFQNPEKYIGNLATITYKDRLRSGKFRVPIHKGMRTLW